LALAVAGALFDVGAAANIFAFLVWPLFGLSLVLFGAVAVYDGEIPKPPARWLFVYEAMVSVSVIFIAAGAGWFVSAGVYTASAAVNLGTLWLINDRAE
jgi:hypothetical protein